MISIENDDETLCGLFVEGITEDAILFSVEIPINKKLGEGFHGIDTTGRSFFLWLIERVKDGL